MDSEHIFIGYSVGAIDYILKPFDPLILKSKVERFVELYQLQKKIISQSEALEEKNKLIEYMAYHDGLTNLPNRRMFQDVLNRKLAESKNKNETLGLMYLDLDRFKAINDSLGHIMGDKLLQEASKRIVESVRKSDFVARIGGDEFIIILSGSSREECLDVAETLIANFNLPIFIDEFEFYITTCIGLSIFPFDGEDTNTLLKNADAALYRAKEQGKSKLKLYHSGMNMESYRQFILQNDLRKAIDSGQFTLVYQPKVNLKTNQIDSAESLIRWNHPKWGLIRPDEFISIAEESNLIFEIDQWVFKKVCEQITYWQETFNRTIKVSVNFSAKHFMQRQLIEQLKDILDESKTDTELLEIEITESVLLNNTDHVKMTLHQIKELNIKISLDDYGKGYSSVNYLREFPFDTVKIDKEFIQEIIHPEKNTRIIIESTIALIKKLGIKVIAEGVETIEQLNLLKELNCDEVQGYLYSKPLSAADFMRFVDQHHQSGNQMDSELIEKTGNKNRLQSKEEMGINKNLIDLSIHKIKIEYSLSSRELDVFALIVDGLSNKEISAKLFISEHTVKNHITNIFSKLTVSDRVQAIALVYETCINVEKIR